MQTSRGAFLAGTAAASVATTSIASNAVAAVAGNARGMVFTTLLDDGGEHLGIRTERGVVFVGRAAAALGIKNYPRTVEELVSGRSDTSTLARIAAKAPSSALFAEDAVTYGKLVSRPPKIICVGLNYRAHLAETGEKLPPFPDLFNKYNTSLNSHNGTVSVSTTPFHNFDYESELVMIVGKRARNVSEADALGYVFGYAAGHDFTARDAQMRVSQWMTGKTPISSLRWDRGSSARIRSPIRRRYRSKPSSTTKRRRGKI